ncbi:MAG: LamG-like jellyroll fold domain-containing protein [Leptolyngbyaceae bacterium]|nr:LamG-like jellyroll fold domain-containing protein [Leptolyngbyaceae bacterium]
MIIANAITVLGTKNTVGSIQWWRGLSGNVTVNPDDIIYDPISAADLNASYVNLANPGTNDVGVGSAPVFTNGWVFNGTSNYLSGIQPFGPSKTLIIWFEKFGQTGIYGAGDNKLLVRPYLSPATTRLTLQTNADLIGDTQCGILGLRRGQPIFRNGKNTGVNLSSTWPAGTDYPIFIGARNSAGTPLQFGAGSVYMYALYNRVLSDAEIKDVQDGMIAKYSETSPYESQVLSTNPIVYFPCNNSKGYFMVDKVSNIGSQSSRFGPTAGADGPIGKGKAIQGGSTASSSYCVAGDSWPVTAGVNLNEFSVAFWIKNINADPQARPCNIYSNTGAEYLAVEIRSGNIAMYFDDSGAVWNTGTLAVTPNDTWAHVVAYRSTSKGTCGIYLNGTHYTGAYSGLAGAYTTGVPDNQYPFLVQSMTGAMSDIAFYNHDLTQSEVNSLL